MKLVHHSSPQRTLLCRSGGVAVPSYYWPHTILSSLNLELIPVQQSRMLYITISYSLYERLIASANLLRHLGNLHNFPEQPPTTTVLVDRGPKEPVRSVVWPGPPVDTFVF